MHEICEGDKINNNIGGDDVASVEELEMRSSKDSVNDNDDLVNLFDASTCLGDNVYDIFDNKDKIITEDLNVWVNTKRKIWEWRFIQITYSELPQDSNNHKLIWINT